MSMPLIDTDTEHGAVIYPEGDGKPMAENPMQGRVIRTLVCGFERLFAGRADVFVGGDFFWYPVEGDNKTVTAPDVTVIADLPKPVDIRAMGSYRQWVFGGRVMMAIEVLSPSNTWSEMARKLEFYKRHGVAEYWMFDPLGGALAVFVRDGDNFLVIADAAAGWTSPNTGVHVSVDDLELVVHGADGRRWLSPADEARRADEMAARADEMAARADEMAARAEVADAEIAELRAELARLRGRSE